MPKAQDGDKVTVTYVGTLEDGTPFDASDEEDPLVFVVGEGAVLPGFERAVVGMEVGEQKTFHLPPEQAYGLRQQRLVDQVALDNLPSDLDLAVGTRLEVKTQDGSTFKVTVVERDADKVTLDANHPLAGHTLNFHLELLAINRPTIN